MGPYLADHPIFVSLTVNFVRPISQVKDTPIFVFSSEGQSVERRCSSGSLPALAFSSPVAFAAIDCASLPCVSDAWLSSSRTLRSIFGVTYITTSGVQKIKIDQGYGFTLTCLASRFDRGTEDRFGSNGVEAKAMDNASSSGLAGAAASSDLDGRR